MNRELIEKSARSRRLVTKGQKIAWGKPTSRGGDTDSLAHMCAGMSEPRTMYLQAHVIEGTKVFIGRCSLCRTAVLKEAR